MSALADKQRRFAKRIAEWLSWVYAQGFAVTFGEAYRTPEQAALDAAKGSGIAHSLHTERLALDINLFRLNTAGVWEWLDTGAEPEWTLVGAHWENMSAENCWGGRFGDPNHISITHDGRK